MAFENYHSGLIRRVAPNSSPNSMNHASQQLRSPLMNQKGLTTFSWILYFLTTLVSFGPPCLRFSYSTLSMLPCLLDFSLKSATVTITAFKSEKDDEQPGYQQYAILCFECLCWI